MLWFLALEAFIGSDGALSCYLIERAMSWIIEAWPSHIVTGFLLLPPPLLFALIPQMLLRWLADIYRSLPATRGPILPSSTIIMRHRHRNHILSSDRRCDNCALRLARQPLFLEVMGVWGQNCHAEWCAGVHKGGRLADCQGRHWVPAAFLFPTTWRLLVKITFMTCKRPWSLLALFSTHLIFIFVVRFVLVRDPRWLSPFFIPFCEVPTTGLKDLLHLDILRLVWNIQSVNRIVVLDEDFGWGFSSRLFWMPPVRRLVCSLSWSSICIFPRSLRSLFGIIILWRRIYVRFTCFYRFINVE